MVTFSTATETTAIASTLFVKSVLALFNDVIVFCETVAIGAIDVFVFAVFVATTSVIAEFNAAICALAVSIAA